MRTFKYLPQWTIGNVELRDGSYVAAATYPESPRDNCPRCKATGALSRYGSKRTSYRDAPIHGRPTVIIVERQRYRCKACNATSLQQVPGANERHRMLARCLDHIRQQCVRQSFSHIAQTVGVDEKTVRLVASERINELREVEPLSPYRLGIAEVSIARKPRLIFADVDAPQIIDLLETHGQRPLLSWLDRLPDRRRIKVVAIEMNSAYRDAVRSKLPQASIVVDRGQIVTLLDRSFNTVVKEEIRGIDRTKRKRLLAKLILLERPSCELTPNQVVSLKAMLVQHPNLGAAYEAKERFHNLCRLASTTKAKAAYALWHKHLPDTLRPAFRSLLAVMSTWETEFLESWNHPRTEDFVAFADKGISAVNRLGKGYSFPVLRARLLFGQPFSGNAFVCTGCLGEFPIEVGEKGRPPEKRWCPNCNRLRAVEWFKVK